MSNLRQIPTLQSKYHVSTDSLKLETTRTFCWRHAEVGDDIAEVLGVIDYEPPTDEELEGSLKHAGDDVAPAPPMINAPKYDVESVYKYADCFEPGEPVYVSEKIDGQNARYVSKLGPRYTERTPGGQIDAEDYTFHAGSRTEWKMEEVGSNWGRAIEQDPWIKEWMISNPESVLYGEVFGWVQPLHYGAKQGQLSSAPSTSLSARST